MKNLSFLNNRISFIKDLYPLLVFACLFCIYLYNGSTSMTFGDSLGFYKAAEQGYELSTAAVSHFLYANAFALFYKSTPFSIYFSGILFSILSSIIALYFLYKTIFTLTQNKITALCSVVVMGLSFTFWRQTEIIEVYSFNNLFFSILLYLTICDLINNKNDNNYATSIIYGLILIIHIQNILLIPFFFIYLIHSNNYQINLNTIYSVSIVTLIFSILLIIPLIYQTNTISSIFFQNKEIGEKVLGLEFTTFLKGGIKSLGYLAYNFHIFIIFFILGLIRIYNTNKKFFILIISGILPFWGFAMRFDVPDNYVFFLQPYFLLVIAGAIAGNDLIKKTKLHFLIPVSLTLIIPVFYYSLYLTAIKVSFLKELHEKKLYKGGLKYLTWPGMRNNPNMLDYCKIIYLSDSKPENFTEFEWNYYSAIEYLDKKGELQNKK
ncbi:MAG: protein O-mannosyl-transferase family [Cytophagaceae bacterium]